MSTPARSTTRGFADAVDMKRFEFRFEAVRMQREAMLDLAKGKLGEVIGRYTLAVDLIAERRASLALVAGHTDRPGQPIDPRRALLRQNHLQALRDEIKRREHQLESLQKAVDEARAEVAKAHHALRAIEVLEERDREAWKEETRREEQQEADERSAQRFGRD